MKITPKEIIEEINRPANPDLDLRGAFEEFLDQSKTPEVMFGIVDDVDYTNGVIYAHTAQGEDFEAILENEGELQENRRYKFIKNGEVIKLAWPILLK